MPARAYGAAAREDSLNEHVAGSGDGAEEIQLGASEGVGEQPQADPDDPGATGDVGATGEGVIETGAPERIGRKHRTKKEQRKYARDRYQERKKATAAAAGKAETSASSRKAAAQTTIDLNNILFSLHQMGAVFLKAPGLVITEQEAKSLAVAITRVTELYEIPLMDEKTRAWINLGLVGLEVYGTRITVAVMQSKKHKPQILAFDREAPGAVGPNPVNGEANVNQA